MAKLQYRGEHQRLKEAFRIAVNAGQAWCTEDTCLMPTRWIPPGTAWDLAHNHQIGGYKGPAHAKCNRTEGAKRSPTRGWGGVNHKRRVIKWNSREW
jgi:hypothetical protein